MIDTTLFHQIKRISQLEQFMASYHNTESSKERLKMFLTGIKNRFVPKLDGYIFSDRGTKLWNILTEFGSVFVTVRDKKINIIYSDSYKNTKERIIKQYKDSDDIMNQLIKDLES